MRRLLANRAVWRAVLLTELIVVPIGLLALFYLLVNALPLVELSDAAGAVAISFGAALVGYGLFAVRLSWVLESFRIPLRRVSVWRIHLTSLFYYFFLPAGIGYDFSKVAKIALRSPVHGTWHVAAAVVAERAAGGAGVYVLLLATLPLTRLDPGSGLAWLAVPEWAWLLFVAALFAAWWLVVHAARRSSAFDAGPLLPAVLISVLSHLIVAGAIWFVAQSLGIRAGIPEVVVALAATLLLQLVPVNLLGVTLGEVAAVTVYLGYGLDKPEALLLATVAYSHRLVCALLGGALEAVGAWRALHESAAESVDDTRSGIRTSSEAR